MARDECRAMPVRPRSTCSGATPHPPLRRFIPLAFLLATTASGQSALQSNDQQPPTLWYRTPATTWNEALPIGNGRLGAMVFGGVEHEHLQLNEHTLWSGHRTTIDRPETAAALPKVRQLLFEGKYSEAQAMAQRDMMGR